MARVNIITIVLVISQIIYQYGGEAKKHALEEDLELERQLHILNKPPIKTFHIKNGDIFDCIDIYKQPALNHPLLKNHKIQMRPTSWKKGLDKKNSSDTKISIAMLRSITCPPGTIPIRRTHKKDLLRAKEFFKSYSANVYKYDNAFPSHHVVAVKPFNDKKTNYYGAGAYINVYNLEVENKQQTTAQIWIENGSSNQRNSLQVGWMVAPQVVGDNRTRLFSYWTADSSKTGCYNTLCPGFVQVDKTYTVGMELTGIFKYGDPYQRYIPINISKDRRTGNWWLYWFSTPVGYWPNLIVPSLGRGASLVAWGGATIGIPNGYSPPMGNGHFPGVDFTRKECFIAKLHMYDAYNNIIYPDKNHMDATVDSPKCYGVQYYGYQDKSFEHVIGFGGPGGKC